MSDRRKIVGSFVKAKAIHVLNDTNARMRFGSNTNNKMLEGVVREVE